jgi:hypothetical protein
MAPKGGKLVSQEIGGCLACRRLELVWLYAAGQFGLARLVTAVLDSGGQPMA